MDRSYRQGLVIVLAIVTISAGLCLARVDGEHRPPPAGEDLSAHPLPLGAFRLTERSGREVTDADLADRVWIASFVFTRCPLSCPKITRVMAELQDELAGSGVRLVSVSVDPEYDTPAILSAYARRFGADPQRWWFLTGAKEAVYHLSQDRFKLSVVETGAPRAGTEWITHTDRLALVDRGNQVIGFFVSDDAEALKRLVTQARKLDRPWVGRMPEVNASLNAACAGLLVLGWILIRAGKVRSHIVCMALAVAVAALFLTCYLIYHYHVGSVAFQGVGPIRVVYFTILLSHTVLAVVMVPLVVLTLTRAIRRRFLAHARIARVTFPIWLYVSITGVVIYLMLYQMSMPTSLVLS